MTEDKQPVPPPPAGTAAAPVHAELSQQPTARMEAPELTPLIPPKPGKKLLMTTFLLAVAAAGLGYYSFTLLQSQRGTKSELAEQTKVVAAFEVQERAQREKVVALQKENTELSRRGAETATKLEASQGRLAAVESRLEELEEERTEIAARMKEFKKVARSFQRMVDSGKLSINFRRGRMVVELPEMVLFASGSAELSKDGQSALKEVAKILRKVPSKRFIIGGHSDNVPIRPGKSEFSSNWALSAARAVTVTEALVRSGLRPGRLVAAGYGPHDPVASNGTEAGRQKNRRIEIILEPKVRELPDPGSKAKPQATAK